MKKIRDKSLLFALMIITAGCGGKAIFPDKRISVLFFIV